MDCLLLEGHKILFRMTVGLLRLHERRILATRDPVTLLQLLKELARHSYDVEALHKASQMWGGERGERERRRWLGPVKCGEGGETAGSSSAGGICASVPLAKPAARSPPAAPGHDSARVEHEGGGEGSAGGDGEGGAAQ